MDQGKFRDITVLCVEDDPVMVLLLERFLSGSVRRVFSACDGKAGMDAFCAEHPDIVVADLMMPIVDGFEMIRRIRQEAPQVPVVALTSSSDIPTIERLGELDVDEYVVKPILRPLLLDALDRCILRLPRREGTPAA